MEEGSIRNMFYTVVMKKSDHKVMGNMKKFPILDQRENQNFNLKVHTYRYLVVVMVNAWLDMDVISLFCKSLQTFIEKGIHVF